MIDGTFLFTYVKICTASLSLQNLVKTDQHKYSLKTIFKVITITKYKRSQIWLTGINRYSWCVAYMMLTSNQFPSCAIIYNIKELSRRIKCVAYWYIMYYLWPKTLKVYFWVPHTLSEANGNIGRGINKGKGPHLIYYRILTSAA